jgi:dTMP kinase
VFITLEGPDGSGKTTQFHRITAWLRNRSVNVLPLREPGGTPISEAVREVLLHHKDGAAMDARAELLLFCAARAQLVAERIIPHLAAGGTVLCDRFADCTIAYQGYGRGLDLGILRDLLHFATRGTTPDLTLLFDVDPELGLKRRTTGGALNRLDAEPLEYHERVRAGYRLLAAQAPERWVTVDAAQPVDKVFETIIAILESRQAV